MRELFPGHFSRTTEEIDHVWKNCLFMLDANVLLNLYRYSDTTTEDFFKLLENRKIKENLLIPHRAVEEFLAARNQVISEQTESYDSVIKKVNELISDFKNQRKHPFISDKLFTSLNSISEKLLGELDENKIIHSNRHQVDEILSRLDSLLTSRISNEMDHDVLIELFRIGAERYKNKIPPGYKDISKSTNDDSFVNKKRVYSDLLIWEQVIEESIKSERPVIFVTDDSKEDWWEIASGNRTIGPRPELINEFISRTKNLVLIYKPDTFFRLASEFLSEPVSPDSQEEISEVSKTRVKLNLSKESINQMQQTIRKINEQNERNVAQLYALNAEREGLLERYNYLRQSFDGDSKPFSEYHKNELHKISECKHRIDELSDKLSNIQQDQKFLSELKLDNVKKLSAIFDGFSSE